MNLLTNMRSHSDYWLYFFSILLSLVGIDLFVYTQGWYVLQLTGDNLSVGFSWSIFFTPSLLFLPIMGKMLDSPNVKKVLMGFEFAKAAILLLFIPLLYLLPNVHLVYLMSALFGIFFATFYPSIYVVLKKVAPSEATAKYSHLFELSIQIASVLAMALAGLLYNALGFLTLAGMGGILLICSGLLISKIKIKSLDDSNSFRLLQEYRNFISLVRTVFSRKDNSNKRLYLFGVFHQFPQNIVLAVNIPILLYVYQVMQKGPMEYGILDGVAGFAALLTGLFWTRFYKSGQSRWLMLCMPLLTAFSFVLIAIIHPVSIVPYLAFFLMSAFLTSSKIQCRAAVLLATPAEVMGKLTTFYQTISYAVMIILAFSTSYLCHTMSISRVFVVFAILMAAFTFFLLLIYEPEPQAILEQVTS